MSNFKAEEVRVAGHPEILTLVTEWPERPDRGILSLGFRGPGYYFWDELQTGVRGPYKTVEKTLTAIQKYSEWLNAEKETTADSEECKS